MIRRILLALTFLTMPAVAMACPNWQLDAPQVLSYSGDDLWVPKRHSVVAGGRNDLTKCGIRAGNGQQVVGWAESTPDFELRYSGGKYDLELRVESNCDAVILINTGLGNWYFKDDDAQRGDANIRLTRPSTGVYDIWVGTYGPELCDGAFLALETF